MPQVYLIIQLLDLREEVTNEDLLAKFLKNDLLGSQAIKLVLKFHLRWILHTCNINMHILTPIITAISHSENTLRIFDIFV